jgi:hypothetical protein
MEKNIKILLVLGTLITIILLFVDIYLAGIVCIIFIVIVMSMLIMQDSSGIPDIRAALKGDAKVILVTNKGNAKAVKIHSTLVPLNIEFDIPVLEVESTFEFPLASMVDEVKIIITFQNEEGRPFSRSAKLSALEEEPDLLKPMIPLFKWK